MAQRDHKDGQQHGHAHTHEHGSAHHHHHAPEVTEGNARAVGFAAILTGLFMLAEVAGGLVSGSLALLADAGHMLTDFGALAMSWLGFRLARRPADWRRTYGFDRFSVLVAFVNGLALFVIAAIICWEAFERLAAPAPVTGSVMLMVAAGGLLVNLIALKLLAGGDRHNLNIRAASLHVMGDLLGSVAAIGAALIIMATGWTPIDPILSILVALIILRGALQVTRESAHILLEGAPEGLEANRVASDLTGHVADVMEVHHVHAWSISQRRPMLTLHARVTPGADHAAVRAGIRRRLEQEFEAEHVTIEVEEGVAPSGECDSGTEQCC